MNRRALVAVGAIVAIFLAVQLGALALVEPFDEAGLQPVENPSDPTNSVLYVLVILVATAGMLAAIRFGAEQLIRVAIIATSGFLAYYVFSVLLPPIGAAQVAGVTGVTGVAGVAGVAGIHPPAILGAVGLAGALLVYPEWYVIDAAGIVMGAGAAGLFGIGFGALPALVLLVVLAVYDAVSVYGTEHMLTLASGVMDLRIPVVLVVPLSLSYSFLDAEMPATVQGEDGTGDENHTEPSAPADPSGPTDASAPTDGPPADGAEDPADGAEDPADPLERDAFFIGLGDAVIPTILVASAGFFGSEASLGVPGLALTLPALTAMVGILLGLLVLMWLVMAGRAHAGLPLLNGGAIVGYLVGAFAAGIPLVEAVGVAPYL